MEFAQMEVPCLTMAKLPEPKEPVNFRIPSSLLAELDKVVEAQPLETSRSAVMIAALREWLERHGKRKLDKR
jgi:Arc/MetJ-type ribon-helix-helix transcriptional regulator